MNNMGIEAGDLVEVDFDKIPLHPRGSQARVIKSWDNKNLFPVMLVCWLFEGNDSREYSSACFRKIEEDDLNLEL